jgi:hypothetical protein
MTLVAAIPCQGDSWVILADSQESHGDLQTPVEKLLVQRSPNLHFAFAAAGNSGELIDELGMRLAAAVRQLKTAKRPVIAATLEQTLTAFYGSPMVVNHPATSDDKRIDGVVCVTGPNGVQTFRCLATRLIADPPRFMTGMYYPLHEAALARFYRDKLPTYQAVLLGLHLFWLAEPSLAVGGKVAVAIAEGWTIRTLPTTVVQQAQARVVRFMQATDDLFLACADTALSSPEFSARLETFSAEIDRLRKEVVQEEAERIMADPNCLDNYSPLPVTPGIRITKHQDGRVTFRENTPQEDADDVQRQEPDDEPTPADE